MLFTDEVWSRIEPLLPARPKGGRPPIPDRDVLRGILFVIRTGCPWEHLPQEMNCGSGMTCWRRLRDWQAAGAWEKIWRVLLNELGITDDIDWPKTAAGSTSDATMDKDQQRPIPRLTVKMARNDILAVAKRPSWQLPRPARSAGTQTKVLRRSIPRYQTRVAFGDSSWRVDGRRPCVTRLHSSGQSPDWGVPPQTDVTKFCFSMRQDRD